LLYEDKKIKKYYFLSFAPCFSSPLWKPGAERQRHSRTKIHSYLRQGIDKAFNLDTARSDFYIKKAVDLDPEKSRRIRLSGYAPIVFLRDVL